MIFTMNTGRLGVGGVYLDAYEDASQASQIIFL